MALHLERSRHSLRAKGLSVAVCNFQRLLKAPLLLSKAFLGLRPRYPAQDSGEEQDSQRHTTCSWPDPSPESQSDLSKTHSQLEAGLEGLMPASLSHTSLNVEKGSRAPNGVLGTVLGSCCGYVTSQCHPMALPGQLSYSSWAALPPVVSL